MFLKIKIYDIKPASSHHEWSFPYSNEQNYLTATVYTMYNATYYIFTVKIQFDEEHILRFFEPSI